MALPATRRFVPMKMSRGVASGRTGHVLNDQHGRLICVFIADAEHAQAPVSTQRDDVALVPDERWSLKLYIGPSVPGTGRLLRPYRSTRIRAYDGRSRRPRTRMGLASRVGLREASRGWFGGKREQGSTT
jgi:hypothetical protein